jgi:hypothetical protein
MTASVPRVSILALGVAAFVSSFPFSTVRANTPPGAATPSLSEPPTVDFWIESGPDESTVAQRPAAHHQARHYVRHYAWRDGRRNPVAAVATGVAGSVADLGSLAAYPFYCFPNYRSCFVRRPYRF